MAKINPRNVFKTADGFAVAAAVLHKEARSGNKLLLTFVFAVLDSLSLELYLKCLILVETGKYERGHDLYKLFKRLSPETRQELSKEHEAFISKGSNFLKTAKAHGFPTDLEGLIIRGRNTFPDFRYPHETSAERQPRNTLFGMRHMPFIVRKRILKTNPKWGNWPEAEGLTLSTSHDHRTKESDA